MVEKLSWSGGVNACLDQPVVELVGSVGVGRYGGYGSTKNEDGLLLWSATDWTFAVLLDGHGGTSSVDAVLDLFGSAEPELMRDPVGGDLQRAIGLLGNQHIADQMAGARQRCRGPPTSCPRKDAP